MLNLLKKKTKLEYKIKKNKNYKETEILKLNSFKTKKILGWFTKLSINEALNRTIEWNNLVIKGKSVKNVCENQFLAFIKKKKIK